MSTKASRDGVTTVREFYELAANNEFEKAARYISPNVVLHETPDVPFGGDYYGLEGNAELMGKITDVLNVAIRDIKIFDAGEFVLVKILARFASKTTDDFVEIKVVEMLTVEDGLITDIDIYYKNPSAVKALWPK